MQIRAIGVESYLSQFRRKNFPQRVFKNSVSKVKHTGQIKKIRPHNSLKELSAGQDFSFKELQEHLFDSIKEFDYSKLDSLIKGNPLLVHAECKQGVYPIHHAILNDNLYAVKSLIKAGAYMNQPLRWRNARNCTVLDLVKSQHYVQFYTSNLEDSCEVSPLFIAVAKGNYDITRLLLQNRAVDIFQSREDNRRGENRLLPIATYAGNFKIVYFLIHYCLFHHLEELTSASGAFERAMMQLAIERGHENVLWIFLLYSFPIHFYKVEKLHDSNPMKKWVVSIVESMKLMQKSYPFYPLRSELEMVATHRFAMSLHKILKQQQIDAYHFWLDYLKKIKSSLPTSHPVEKFLCYSFQKAQEGYMDYTIVLLLILIFDYSEEVSIELYRKFMSYDLKVYVQAKQAFKELSGTQVRKYRDVFNHVDSQLSVLFMRFIQQSTFFPFVDTREKIEDFICRRLVLDKNHQHCSVCC